VNFTVPGPFSILPLDGETLAARQAFIVRAAEEIELFVDADAQRWWILRIRRHTEHANDRWLIQAHAFRYFRKVQLRQLRAASRSKRFQFDCSMRSLVRS
jgi:hypothetical protein